MKEIDPNLPVNNLAAFVVSKDKNSQVQFHAGDMIVSSTPLPIIAYRGMKSHDLTGRKCGRFTVLGVYAVFPGGSSKNHKKTRWVVKCSCGTYQILTPKSIKNNSPNTKCVNCRKTAQLRTDRII